MTNQLTQQEAIAFAYEEKWLNMSFDERAEFQINQDFLCMPLTVFREAVEHWLGRPVWAHEMAKPQLLIEEKAGKLPAATIDDVLEKLVDLVPQEKIIIV